MLLLMSPLIWKHLFAWIRLSKMWVLMFTPLGHCYEVCHELVWLESDGEGDGMICISAIAIFRSHMVVMGRSSFCTYLSGKIRQMFPFFLFLFPLFSNFILKQSLPL